MEKLQDQRINIIIFLLCLIGSTACYNLNRKKNFLDYCENSNDEILQSIYKNANNNEAPYYIVRFFETNNKKYFNIWMQSLFPDIYLIDSTYFVTNLNLTYFNQDKYSRIIFMGSDSKSGVDFSDYNFIINNNMIYDEKKKDSIEVSNGTKTEKIRHVEFFTYLITENMFVRVENVFPDDNQNKLLIQEVDSINVALDLDSLSP